MAAHVKRQQTLVVDEKSVIPLLPLSVLQMTVELGVEPAVGDQLLMTAVFGDAAAIKHQHRSACLTALRR